MGRTVMLKVGLKATREQKVRVKTTARARDRVSQSLYDVRGRVPWRLYSRVFGTGAARSLMGESGGARAVLAEAAEGVHDAEMPGCISDL